MQAPDSRQPDDAELNAPPKLVAALQKSRQRPIFIPRSTDERILRAAREHLQKPESPRFNWLRIIWWGTAAAAIALLALLASQLWRRPSVSQISQVNTLREDINHDGRVDILDAFSLARQLKAGTQPTASTDVNGDGVVDERDVATLAAKAVELPKGGPS